MAYDYDVFISYSHKDDEWVLNKLLPTLEKRRVRVCIDYRDFIAGRAAILNMQEASEKSRHTLLVLTPRWVESEWSLYESMLSRTDDPAGLGRRTIPLLLEKCKPAKFISMLTWVDFTDKRREKDAWKNLFKSLQEIVAAQEEPEAVNEPGEEAVGLPAGSYIPFSHNELFTGREEDLAFLAESLLNRKAKNTVIYQAVTGMGGIGKTQLAVEFGFRYGQRFKGVHWLDLSDSQAVDGAIGLCGTKMGYSYNDQNEQVAATLQSWVTDGPRLIILDNFEDVTHCNDVLSRFQHPSLRLLVTSRRKDFPRSSGLHPRGLGPFSDEESVLFLEKTLDQVETREARKSLADKLGYLPLALALAASYISITKIGIEGYLKELEDVSRLDAEQVKWFKALDIVSPTEHERSLFGTFQLSWRELTEETQQKVFMIAGYLAPNTPIPLEIFEETLDLEQKELSLVLSRLNALGLLPLMDELPIIHPLLAAHARSLSTKELLEQLVDTLAMLAGEANYQIDQTGSLGWFVPLRSHVLSVAEFVEAASIQGASNLFGNFGYYFHEIADYNGAKAAYERALKIDEANYGPDHPKVAIRVSALGLVLRDLGDFEGAKAALERALKIDEATYGLDHPDVARDVNNLGSVLQDLGDLDGAKAAFERALKIDEASYGPDHPNVAIRVNNLGLVLRDLGDFEGAKAAFERALKIDEASYGPDHPKVANRVNSLGLVLRDLGDFEGAKAAFERALKINEASYGPDHPKVATDVNNLGSVLQDLGDLDGAKAAYKRALKIDEASYGPDHPNVAIRVNNLGAVLQNLGDLDGAKAAFERALKIAEASYGPDHPTVARYANNLGAVLYNLGELDGAEAALERVLKIDEASYGPDHPTVAMDVSNLGSVLQELGDLDGAKAAYERALQILKMFLPEGHPNIKIVEENLESLKNEE
jgi:tetratricopeptide (TPR) repeat protein